jgi:hypothetical protein
MILKVILTWAVAKYYRSSRRIGKCFYRSIAAFACLFFLKYRSYLIENWVQKCARNRHSCKTGYRLLLRLDDQQDRQTAKSQFLKYHRIHLYPYKEYRAAREHRQQKEVSKISQSKYTALSFISITKETSFFV